MKEIDPAWLVEALLANGWQLAGQRIGVYTRLGHLRWAKHFLVVPAALIDRDSQEMFDAVVEELRWLAHLARDAQAVLDATTRESFDPQFGHAAASGMKMVPR